MDEENLYTLDEMHEIASQLSMITIGCNESLYERVELNKIDQDFVEIKAIRARGVGVSDSISFNLVPLDHGQNLDNP